MGASQDSCVRSVESTAAVSEREPLAVSDGLGASGCLRRVGSGGQVVRSCAEAGARCLNRVCAENGAGMIRDVAKGTGRNSVNGLP